MSEQTKGRLVTKTSAVNLNDDLRNAAARFREHGKNAERLLGGKVELPPESALELADFLDSHATDRDELIEALREVMEVFSLGPLGCAAKYGPDVDLRELEESAANTAYALLAKHAPKVGVK